MLISSLATGFGAATRHVKLLVLLWLATLVLALPATLAFAAWWWDALAYAAPGRASDLVALVDMVESSEVGPWGMVIAALAGTAIVALVGNALLAGGLLEVLVHDRHHRGVDETPDARRFLHRFFRGAGHFFLRSLAVLLVALLVAALVVGVASAGLGAALRPLDDTQSAALAWTALLLPVGVIAVLVVFLCGVVVDLARIDLVRHDRRNPVASYWKGLTLGLRRWWTTLWIWAIVGGLAGLFVVLHGTVGGGVDAAVPRFVLLQVLVLALAWLRVSAIAAEIEVSVRTWPDPAPAVETTTAAWVAPDLPLPGSRTDTEPAPATSASVTGTSPEAGDAAPSPDRQGGPGPEA